MQSRLLNAILEIERLIYEEHVILKFQDDINRYAKEIIDITLDTQSPQRFAEAIREVFFMKHSFRARVNIAIDNSTAVGAIRNKGATCVGMATIYLIFAERLQFKLFPVLFENHVSVSFNSENKKESFFIETTHQGSVCTFKQITGCHGSIVQKLSLDEFLAIHLVSHSCLHYAINGMTDEAMILIDSALEVFPNYVNGWINRAAIMKKLDNTEEMRRSLDMAKSLNPGLRYTKAIKQIEGEKHE